MTAALGSPSLHHHPTVNNEDLTRAVGRQGRREKGRHRGSVLPRCEPFKCNLFAEGFARLRGHFGGHFRLDEPGCNSVDQNIPGTELFGDGFRKSDQSGFAGGVVGLSLVADQSDDAGDVDDAAAATLHHAARDGPNTGERAAQIGVLYRIPVFVFEAHDDVVAGDTGVVYQDIDRAKRLLDIVDELCDGGRGADVGSESGGDGSDGSGGFIGALLVPTNDGDPCTGFGERLGDGASDSSCAASDKRILTAQIDFHQATSWRSLSTSAAVPQAEVFAALTKRPIGPVSTLPSPIST